MIINKNCKGEPPLRLRKFHLRQIGPSKAAKQRLLVLFIIFLVAFVFFTIIINHKKHYSSKEMTESTLPTITSEAYGCKTTELYGYVESMDACYMRDSIIPLNSKRKIKLDIDTKDNEISQLSYEIRSTDTSRKISEKEINNYSVNSKGHIILNLRLENLLKKGEEYLLVIKMTNKDDQDIYYYTRIIIPSEDCYEEECFNFVKDFHKTALSDDYTSLATYMEPDEDSNPDTLSEVSLKSTLAQIGFDGFDAKPIGQTKVEIKDVSPYYSVIEYNYLMKLDESDKSSLYKVKEYYKVRYGNERIYLLDYRRTMEEYLDINNVTVKNNLVSIGIALDDVNYLSNETGTIAAFVQAGSLYEYNQNSSTISKVFSFDSADDVTKNWNCDQHNIKLLSIDENGNMDFAVYGYMPRGNHEGYCGIDLFHYDAKSDKSIEQAFVATTYSYQILNASFSNLLYKTSDNQFYILVNGDLLHIDLKNMNTSKVLTQLSDTQVAASKSGRYIAYADKPHGDKAITVLDLETNRDYQIYAPTGKKIQPLAFMEEDLVYGYISNKNIDTTIAGTKVYPIDTIYIREAKEKGDILKKYHKDGFYINSVSQTAFTLYMDRIIKTEDGFVAADTDTIKNSTGEKNKAISFKKEYDSVRGENTIIQTNDLISDLNIKRINASLTGFSPARARKTITVDTEDCQQQYYVYMGSSVLLASTDVVKSIQLADQEMGVVVDSSAHYIWRRGKKSYCNSLKGVTPNEADKNTSSISKCLSAILTYANDSVEVNGLIKSGKSPYDVLSNTLKNDIVLDLTGASLQEILYYVSTGFPVYARNGKESALVIVGYDATTITVYNPSSNSYTKLGQAEASKIFEDNGNVFITYVRTEVEDDED